MLRLLLHCRLLRWLEWLSFVDDALSKNTFNRIFCCRLNTFKLCWILLLWVLLLPNATSCQCHILCVYLVPRVQVLIGMMSPPIWLLCCFDCLPSLYLNFTCMRTHIVVSSCHLNAVRSLSADCLSIGCFHSFVCHLTCGRDFSIISLPAEVNASVSSIRSGTKRWEKSGRCKCVWSHN